MKKMINQATISGYLFSHNLTMKQVTNQASANFGKDFINGTIDIAVDEEGINVVTIAYTYVTATTSKGGENKTFSLLKRIIDENPTWSNNGKDLCLKVKATGVRIGVNDFYNQNEELVSAQRLEGGFLSVVTSLGDERNNWEADMFITNCSMVEADEERGTEEHMRVKGAIFDFGGRILPVTFKLKIPAGISFLENLEISPSNPYFSKVIGTVGNVISKRTITEEVAFGEPIVKTIENKSKEWVIERMPSEGYNFGEEDVLTVEEIQKAMQDRELYLADVKKRNDEYRATKNGATAAPSQSIAPKAGTAAFNINF